MLPVLPQYYNWQWSLSHGSSTLPVRSTRGVAWVMVSHESARRRRREVRVRVPPAAPFENHERRRDMPEDKTAGTCPECGGNLCVDMQYPDHVYCDTCDYEFGGES